MLRLNGQAVKAAGRPGMPPPMSRGFRWCMMCRRSAAGAAPRPAGPFSSPLRKGPRCHAHRLRRWRRSTTRIRTVSQWRKASSSSPPSSMPSARCETTSGTGRTSTSSATCCSTTKRGTGLLPSRRTSSWSSASPTTRVHTYLLWEEGKGPDWVLEVTSWSTRQVDQGRKRDLYARLGVSEYWQYDPTGDYLDPPLQGLVLADGGYGAALALGPGWTRSGARTARYWA